MDGRLAGDRKTDQGPKCDTCDAVGSCFGCSLVCGFIWVRKIDGSVTLFQTLSSHKCLPSCSTSVSKQPAVYDCWSTLVHSAWGEKPGKEGAWHRA